MSDGSQVPRFLKSPWPVTLLLLVPLWLLCQSRVWLGLQMGVVRRPILELWVHGAQPGWLDWVPFIHPPGYSLFMNTVDAVSAAADTDPAWLVFWFGAACALGVRLLLVELARRWFGGGPALLVACLAILDPQSLRPFEHYPAAALLLFVAFAAALWRPRLPRSAVVVVALAAVEIHLSSWFVLGPLLAWDMFFGSSKAGGRGTLRRRGGAVIGALLGLFAFTALFGLAEVLSFGGGPKGDPGSPSIEWANPLLLAALLPALASRSWRGPALALWSFCGITWALQALQLADGSPFPYSLHYFELIAAPVLLVVGGAFTTAWSRESVPKALLVVLAVLLVGSQWALFGRGLLELFVQPRWILMVR
ncbi:MAG: hypothetical protein KDA24_11270 [Deltaproteobacteria bacterium]|nr:hypothetical protein [Deltaproteobacteria bacterium]